MSGNIVALIPAAGFATRLGELPCSKELLPVGWSVGGAPPPGSGTGYSGQARPLAGYLLERLARGGIPRAIVITRSEKADIPERLGDGSHWGIDLDYLLVGPTASTVHTLDAAHASVHESIVALGYPDIVFRPADAYRRLIEARAREDADVALGLFPSDQPEKSDMVELGPGGEVRRLVIKQADRGLAFTWSIAVWTPLFTEYLHDFVRRHDGPGRELYVGDVIQSAIDDRMNVTSLAFATGASTDLGTPEALQNPPEWVSDAATPERAERTDR